MSEGLYPCRIAKPIADSRVRQERSSKRTLSPPSEMSASCQEQTQARSVWRKWLGLRLGSFLPRSNLVLIAQGRGPGHSWASPEGEKMDTKSKYDKPTKPADFDLEMAIFGAP